MATAFLKVPSLLRYRDESWKMMVSYTCKMANGTLQMPAGIAVSSKGLIAIADFEKNCIVICDKEGKDCATSGLQGRESWATEQSIKHDIY